MENLTITIIFASIGIFFVSFVAWVYGRIVAKAGLSPWWALFMFIPIVNLIMIWVFAFAKWPALEEPRNKKPSTKTFVAVISLIAVVFAGLIGMTFFVESSVTEVSAEVKKKVEQDLRKDPNFPVLPVWWAKGHIIAVGVIANGFDRTEDAMKVCKIMNRYQIKPAEVQVFDVLKIQESDEWVQIGGAICN